VKLSAGRRLVAQVDYNLFASKAPKAGAVLVGLELDATAREGRWFDVRTQQVALSPNEANATLEAQTVLPADANILDVYPQMRLLGKSMLLMVDHAGATGRACLLDQFRWDFHLLREPRFFTSPQPMKAGNLFTLRCTYDTRGKDSAI